MKPTCRNVTIDESETFDDRENRTEPPVSNAALWITVLLTAYVLA